MLANKNEQGSIELTFILLLMAIFFMIIFVMGHLKLFSHYRSDLYLHALCAKKIMTQTPLHIKKIQKINQFIKIINTTKLVFAPTGWGLGTKIAAQKAKKLLILQQNLLHFSYMKQLTSLQRNKCEISLNTYKTPFETTGLILKRDKSDMAKLRSEIWTSKISSKLLGFYLIWNNREPDQVTVQTSKHKMVLLSHFL
jgi:hypothetical protein